MGGIMSEAKPVALERENGQDALSLAERLDPAIGEATSVVGAMLTELLRRTLRGGVIRLGDEMHGYVSEKLDTVIAERRPELERLAVEVAEHTARTAATEVAVEEVQALEQRTQQGDRALAEQIEAAARAAQQQTATTAETLAAEIVEKTAAASESLTAQIQETARTAQQKTAETAENLAAQIQETERRAQRAQEEIHSLVERAREGSVRLKEKVRNLESTAATLGKQIEESNSRLRDELRELSARVAELEKPRGLRALFAWLFGRKKKQKQEAATKHPQDSKTRPGA
jgi:methyl-accepting chemotaxis protein